MIIIFKNVGEMNVFIKFVLIFKNKKTKAMKRIFIFSMLATALLVTFNSCGGPKKVGSDSEEIQVPFSGKEYQTNKEFFRSTQSGKSPDLSTAKKIALNNSKSEIAGLIKTKIKSVSDNYTNQHSSANAQDFGNKFETMTREIVDQQLNDISIIGEKIFKQKNNSYEYWLVIEISKEALLNGISASVSKDQKLQINYDKKKFEEIYNAEMQSMEQK